ncbi:hypothetical protein, partial [Blautia wexlerae]|uniref:hypothetical protein n=1 Tax=Blautia wexlerae TaxID=418240 RepID=UPI00325BD634
MLRSYIYKPDYIDNTIDLNSNAAKELDWMSFWEQLFVKSVNSSLDSFAHLNEEVTYSRHLNLTDFEVGASCSIALQGKAKT